METGVTIKSGDMPEARQDVAIDLCVAAAEKFTTESDMAGFVKAGMEDYDGPAWHCIVGSSFGSAVSHSRNNFLYLQIPVPRLRTANGSTRSATCYVLLFKTE